MHFMCCQQYIVDKPRHEQATDVLTSRFFNVFRYAGLLEATMDHVPSVCPLEPVELLDFCTDSGYSYRVEAQGSLLIPPDYYVGITDWERSLRLRCARRSLPTYSTLC